LLHVKRLPVQI